MPASFRWGDTFFGVVMLALALFLPARFRALRLGGALFLGLGLFGLFGQQMPEPAPFRWRNDITHALADAKANHQPAMIDFFATWCGACVELDEKTYAQREVRDALQRFVTIKIDGTDETDSVTALYKQYDIKGLPTVVFLDSNGHVLDEPRVTGFVPPAEFLPLLSQVH